MKPRLALALIAAAVLACQQVGPAPQPPAELVLTGGKVVTVDKDFSIKQAVAIGGGKIVALGSDADIRQRVGPNTKVVDLKGRTVIPGLIDSHIHAIRGGLTYDLELHWDRLTSLKAGLDQIAEKAKTTPPGTWIRVIGGWSEFQLTEKRLPTQAELDLIAPNHPVWVQRLYTRAIFNTAAIKALGITATTPDPPGGAILKDQSGKPFGVTNTAGINFYYPNMTRPTLDQQIESTKHWFAELNRVGLTTALDTAGGLQRWPDDYAAVNAIHERGEQTLRVRWFMQPQRAGRELEDVRMFVSLVKPGSGDDMLRPLGIGEAPVAATNDGTQWGADSPTFSAQALQNFGEVLRAAVEAGWSFQMHTARNKSLEQVLPKIEEVNRQTPLKDRHFSFAHLEDVSPQSIERIKALGGGVTVQDRLIYSGDDILRNWTSQAVRRAPPVQSLLKAGVPVGGGTDATTVAPYEPFLSLWWLITGRTIDGRQVRGPDELLTREQALRVYTTGSAWFSGEEDRLGSLEPGKFADLVVLSADYLSVAEDDIRGIESLLTIVGGKPVYAGAEFKGLVRN